jgi:hypothetical protein
MDLEAPMLKTQPFLLIPVGKLTMLKTLVTHRISAKLQPLLLNTTKLNCEYYD